MATGDEDENSKEVWRRNDKEFDEAIREIATRGPIALRSPYDRVRVSEWLRKLTSMPAETPQQSRHRNEYMQLLRIMAVRGVVHGTFVRPPPEGRLPPLAERLGNEMNAQIPELPRSGPVAPNIVHRSPDGRAYLSIRRTKEGGVLCYCAVSPDVAAD